MIDFDKMQFGRLPEFDERSRQYPIRQLLEATPKLFQSYTWKCPIVLNQGFTPHCAGFAVSHEAAAKPVMVKGITNAIGDEMYFLAQTLDQYEGEAYDGTTTLGAVKAGVKKGWFKSYYWAFGEQDLAIGIPHKGPAILGINWYESMNRPDANGLITVSGKCVGGHCILANGYNHKHRLYRLHQSWGEPWGINGECFISADDMARLLKEEGEAVFPIGRRLK
jgi:hypothetical protein